MDRHLVHKVTTTDIQIISILFRLSTQESAGVEFKIFHWNDFKFDRVGLSGTIPSALCTQLEICEELVVQS